MTMHQRNLFQLCEIVGYLNIKKFKTYFMTVHGLKLSTKSVLRNEDVETVDPNVVRFLLLHPK